MKTSKLFLVVLVFSSMTIYSQENIIKGGFVASGGTNFGIQYERALSNNFSIIGQFGFAEILDVFYNESSTGYGLYGEGRYYFTKNKDLMEGWHAGVYVTYMNTNYDDDWFSYDQNSLGIGAVGGYQWIFSSHITLDTLIGGGYLSFDGDFEGDTGFYPLIGLNVGYNF